MGKDLNEMRPGKLSVGMHKLMSGPVVESGPQSPVLVTSAASLHHHSGDSPTSCVSDHRAQELDTCTQGIVRKG